MKKFCSCGKISGAYFLPCPVCGKPYPNAEKLKRAHEQSCAKYQRRIKKT